MAKAGRVPTKDRQAYRAVVADDVQWGRPELKTAELVWAALETWDWLPPVRLHDLLPKRGCTEDDIRIARQSLTVAMDCAVTVAGHGAKSGGRGVMFTKNTLFDAIALRWSSSYRKARRAGARVSYDMKTETVTQALRELVLAGVRFDTLWTIVTGRWSQSGLNRLFSTRRLGSKRGHALGYRVDVNLGSAALEEFETALEHDRQYRRRPQAWPLLLADAPMPRRPIRRKVCAEQPYNVVRLGRESTRVLAILESTRVAFNVELFRRDYEARRGQYLQLKAEPSRVRTPEERRQYRKLEGFVAAWRRLYRQTETLPLAEPLERIDEETWAGGVPRQLWIRSRFFRASNRRYHAANFWPERAPKEFRDRWFSLPVHDPGEDAVYEQISDSDFFMEHDRIPPHTAPGSYVERDVVTSQVQTLAVFLNIKELEELAAGDIKGWLADRMQASRLLADGYEGAVGRKRLLAFAKAHLMRLYGGALNKIVAKCGRDEAKHGPGWRTTRGLWAKPTIKAGTKGVVLEPSGVTEAAAVAERFFLELPPWIDELDTFLEACRALAAKSPGGVVFHDPLEPRIEVRWDHAQRGDADPIGHEEIVVRPWGKRTEKRGFIPMPAGTIDQAELRRYVTPCLTHMLDSYFSSHVIRGLQAAGVTDVVALHDNWLVGEALPAPDEPEAVLSGLTVLERAIAAAGRPWLEGLGVVYDDLIAALGGDPTFGPFVHEIKARWDQRKAAERWPKLLSH